VNWNQLERIRRNQAHILAELNSIHRILNPQSGVNLTKGDVKLHKWAFWSDQKSDEHIQFAAYKCKQKLIRAQEEEDYTQQKIYSVLTWSMKNLRTAQTQYEGSLEIDQTSIWTSKAFYCEKLRQLQERNELWNQVLRPYLSKDFLEIDSVN
jgi:hypothetical protein